MSALVVLDHREQVQAKVYPMPHWAKVGEWRPVYDVPILIWRASFTDDDYPVYGRFCSCHGRYIYSEDGWQTVQYADDATHWKDAYSGPTGG